MAQTTDEIAAQLRLDYPFPQQVNVGGVQRDMTQAEYDQWISDQSISVRAQQIADEAAAVEAEIRRITALAMTKLEENYTALNNSSVNLTVPQMRTMLGDVTKVVYHMIRIMRNRGIIES